MWLVNLHYLFLFENTIISPFFAKQISIFPFPKTDSTIPNAIVLVWVLTSDLIADIMSKKKEKI